jgi:hypothetical protein
MKERKADANRPKNSHRPKDSPDPQDPQKKGGIDIDDAQLDDVTDDSAFKNGKRPDEEITDENQRSESRAEPRRPI